MSWAVDTRPESSLLWLHGSAGAGKSAIAQTIAGYCSDQGRLGAAFFFKRGDPERGTWNRLFTTIAYQLARAFPALRVPVQNTAESDYMIAGRTMEIQFAHLLVEPFKQLPPSEIIPVIVVDGLEECENHERHQEILHLFIQAMRARELPVRILITSRPEAHIRRILRSEDVLDICRHVELSADESAYADIRAYLVHEFSRIRSDYLDTGLDFPEEWPPPDALSHLVEKSSGIFLYATTVIHFVGDEYSNPPDPRERLDLVLNLDPQSTATLDDLYARILSVEQQGVHQLRILHCIWQATLGSESLTLGPEEMDLLLGLGRGTSRLILRRLHSLLHVPPIPTRFSYRGELSVLHASFADYLGDARRSGPWCVATEDLRTDYLHSMIRLLSTPPDGDAERAFHEYEHRSPLHFFVALTWYRFRREAVTALPQVLSHATPSDDLIRRMFSALSAVFLTGEKIDSEVVPWPQVRSHSSNDLRGLIE